MNIIRQTNRGLIALDAMVNGILKKRSNDKALKKILIIFQQIFGDVILFSKAMSGYAELYPKKNGYQITLLARPSVLAFMKATVPLIEDIDIQPVDFKKLMENYSYYKEIVGKYRNFADIIIVPGSSLSAEILISACNANRKIGLVRSIPIKWPPIMAAFYHLAYNEKVIPENEQMMLQRHRCLLNYLKLENFQAKLPTLLLKKRIIEDAHYVVVCPGASKKEKCWPTDRFVKIIDYIIETYQLNVHLCGSSDELSLERFILRNVKHPDNVISHIGKTNFSDWSSIIQHADLILGNDSATLHLAAAARVPSICIVGVYDKFQFFPYKVDLLEEGDILPITLFKDMPCAWCRTIGYHSGYGNSECIKKMKANGAALCIDAISVGEVVDKIQQIFAINKKYRIGDNAYEFSKRH